MLIWINGPFGVGKTQTAFALARRLPNSVVSDPEQLGFGLHRMMPPALRGDFQDLPVWRAGVVEVLERVLAGHDGPVVVPMTVTDPRYFAETVGRLRGRGHDVHHVALLAERDVVVRRLRERVIGHAAATLIGARTLRHQSFALARLDDALAHLQDPQFAEHIHTDTLDLAAVVERIADGAGLDLAPDHDSPMRRRLRRLQVGVRHIRLG